MLILIACGMPMPSDTMDPYMPMPAMPTLDDIALSLAPEITGSCVVIWVRVGANRAHDLYNTSSFQ